MGSCEVVSGRGGLPTVKIVNDAATAEISLMGGHLISYIPKKDSEMIFVSPATRYQEGVPIRGGAPICWPWFGKHPDGGDKPMHGFARQMMWEYGGVKSACANCTAVTLVLKSSDATKAFWPYDFELELEVVVADKLTMTLKTTNTDTRAFTISQAIHTYFLISDISAITILGFEDKDYFNKVGGANDLRHNDGMIKVTGEIDGVYKHAPGPFQIIDPKAARTIHVATAGSDSAVCWNPWIEKSKTLSDYTPDAYKTMICVETCNALEDARTIQPGESHAMTAIYSIEK